MIVSNIISTRSNKAVANQFIIKTDKYVFFQSYRKLVAKIDRISGEVTLSQYWNFSRTTRKYLYQILDIYGYEGMTIDKVAKFIENCEFKYVDLITY